MILSLLYRLYPKQFHKLVFESQRKPVNFESLELVFLDSNGKKHYQYPSEKLMPIFRKGHMEKCFMEMSMQLHSKELRPIIDAMEKALNRHDKQGAMSPDIVMMGFLITEMKNREQMLVHEEICMDLLAAMFIREDENPEKFDEEIHAQKIQQLTVDSQGGLRDFFYGEVLSKFTPSLSGSSEELAAAARASRIRIAALKKLVEGYSSEKP